MVCRCTFPKPQTHTSRPGLSRSSRAGVMCREAAASPQSFSLNLRQKFLDVCDHLFDLCPVELTESAVRSVIADIRPDLQLLGLGPAESVPSAQVID